jgi:hypothetical protein
MDDNDREDLKARLAEAKRDEVESMDVAELADEAPLAGPLLQDAFEDAREEVMRHYERQVKEMDDEELEAEANQLGVRMP